MRNSLLSLLVPALLTCSSFALAADPAYTSEADRLFKDGVKLMNARHFEDARLKLALANGILHNTDILWNLMLAESESRHYADALNHSYQLLHDPRATPTELEYLRGTAIPRASREVGQLEIDAPSGALVEIDSKEEAGHAPLPDPLAVSPGPHRVVAILGATRLTKDVEVAAGQRVHVTLGSDPQVPPAPAAAAATLDARSTLAQEGAPAPGSPSAQGPEEPGEARGDEAQRAKQRNYGIGFGIATGVLAITSGVLFAVAETNGSISDAQRAHPAGTCPSSGCPDLDSAIHTTRTQAYAAWGFAGGAALTAVGGVALWVALAPRAHAEHTGLQILPAVGPGNAGLLLRSSF